MPLSTTTPTTTTTTTYPLKPTDADKAKVDKAKADKDAHDSRATSKPVGKTDLPGKTDYPPLKTDAERAVSSRTQLIQNWEDNPNEPYPHVPPVPDPTPTPPPPPTEPSAAAMFASVLQQIADTWNSVGHTNVNDQPVKQASDSEMDRLTELLAQASKYVSAAKKERAKADA